MIVENKKTGWTLEAIRAPDKAIQRDMDLGAGDSFVMLYSNREGLRRERGSKGEENQQLEALGLFGDCYKSAKDELSPTNVFGGHYKVPVSKKD